VDNQPSLEAAEQLWRQIAGLLRAELGDATWRTWLEGVRAVALTGDSLTLTVPNAVASRRIKSIFAAVTRESLRQSAGK